MSGCQRVVFASSAAVYGDAAVSPQSEDASLAPLSVFALSKIAGEQLCDLYRRVHHVETIVLRYFNVYGPRQAGEQTGVIAALSEALAKGEAARIFGDGQQTRDFIYVDDVVRANMLAATSTNDQRFTFNVGTGIATNLILLAKTLGGMMDKHEQLMHLPAKQGDVRHSVADPLLASQELGFSATTSLVSGLQITLGGSNPVESPDAASNSTEVLLVDRGLSPEDQITPAGQETPAKRAVVCFVDDNRNLIQQTLALRLSLLETGASDTDLVVMGPEHILKKMPEDVVKVPQAPAADDPVWQKYRFINSISSLNGSGAHVLNNYSHILRTDVDTFILPGWHEYRPSTFVWGRGGYSNNDEIRERLKAISAEYGLVHRGHVNIGSTWYGPTGVVRRAAAFSEMLAKHILTTYFREDEGKWPGWYAGVATLYAGEIAVNHCATDGQFSDVLDCGSTSREPVFKFPHIHCWHTDEKFSKHWFMSGRYSEETDGQNLDENVVADYCMAVSFRSLHDYSRFFGAEIST